MTKRFLYKGYHNLLHILLACMLTGCIPEGIELPNLYSVTTVNVEDITAHGAKLTGKVEIGDTYPTATCGFIHGLSPTLSSAEGVLDSTTSNGEYSIPISGLEANTTYYYRAYAIDAGWYRYGEVRSFITEKDVTVTTGGAMNMTTSEATLSGAITDAKQPFTCGIIYGTSSTLSSTSGTMKSTTSSSEFSVNVTALSPNTTYYYRAYVVVDGEWRYGEVRSFTTKQNVYVVTGDATDVTDSGAILSGTINNSDNPVTCGIIYGTSAPLSSESGTMKSTTSFGEFSVSVAGLSASTTYYYCAYVIVDGVYKSGDVHSFTTESVTPGDVIDLGLGVKWASCNAGADSPEDYGDYFAWGETTPRPLNDKSNSVTYNSSTSGLQSRGIIDSNGNLTAAYDAATANRGSSWRMPTGAELQELYDKCSWSWTTLNGVNGYKVTGPNGNSIFLPAAGYRSGTSFYNVGFYGCYWSATPGSDYINACGLDFYSGFYDLSSSVRNYHQTVRPVTE